MWRNQPGFCQREVATYGHHGCHHCKEHVVRWGPAPGCVHCNQGQTRFPFQTPFLSDMWSLWMRSTLSKSRGHWESVQLLGPPRTWVRILGELGKIPVCEGGEVIKRSGRKGFTKERKGKASLQPFQSPACQMSQPEDAGSELWLGECSTRPHSHMPPP